MLVVLKLVSAARIVSAPILICPESSMALKGAISAVVGALPMTFVHNKVQISVEDDFPVT